MGNLWYYNFQIEYWDNNELIVEQGIVAGFNFPDALQRVMALYQDDDTDRVYLELIQDSENVLVFDYVNVGGEENALCQAKQKLN